MTKIIPVSILLEFYKKGLFPMAENSTSDIVNLYKYGLRYQRGINKFISIRAQKQKPPGQ